MGFQFNDNTIHLDIAGNKFDIDYTPTLIKEAKEFSKKALEQVEKLNAKEENQEEYEKIIFETTDMLKDTIKFICGEDAIEKIFKGRKENFYDLIDVINYILDSFSKFKEKQNSKYSINRIQRRTNEYSNRSYADKHKNKR